MIIEINIQQDSKEYEALTKCLNTLKDKENIHVGIYKDRKEFTTDIDVYYVAEDVLYDIEHEYGVELFDYEKEKLIETVSYRIFNNYDYSEYNDYIADLTREYANQYIIDRKNMADDLLNPKLSTESLTKSWKEVLEQYDIEINSEGEIVYDDGYFFKEMIKDYFMKIEPINGNEDFPKEFKIIFTGDEEVIKDYKIEAKYDEDNYCYLLLNTLEELNS